MRYLRIHVLYFLYFTAKSSILRCRRRARWRFRGPVCSEWRRVTIDGVSLPEALRCWESGGRNEKNHYDRLQYQTPRHHLRHHHHHHHHQRTTRERLDAATADRVSHCSCVVQAVGAGCRSVVGWGVQGSPPPAGPEATVPWDLRKSGENAPKKMLVAGSLITWVLDGSDSCDTWRQNAPFYFKILHMNRKYDCCMHVHCIGIGWRFGLVVTRWPRST